MKVELSLSVKSTERYALLDTDAHTSSSDSDDSIVIVVCDDSFDSMVRLESDSPNFSIDIELVANGIPEFVSDWSFEPPALRWWMIRISGSDDWIDDFDSVTLT